MNMVEKKIYSISPGYLPSFKSMFQKYAQFGGGADSQRYVKGRYFSNVYEMYVFAFFLGLKKEKPFEITDDDILVKFWEVENWKPQEIRDHLIASSIARTDIDLFSLQDLDERELTAEIGKLKNTIEKYANGGLKIIATLIEEDPDSAEQDVFFIGMLS